MDPSSTSQRVTMNPLNGLIVVFTFATLTVQRGEALYRFIPEDVDLVRDCQGEQKMGGVNDFLNLSDFGLSYNDEGIHADGTVDILWDVEENDRISMHSELKKFSRGTWQPTTFTVLTSDYCKEMKDTTSVVYDIWAKHIISEDARCPAKGRKYHHEPFLFTVDFNVRGINMEGRYKIVNYFRAYDEKNREKPNAVCVEIPGESHACPLSLDDFETSNGPIEFNSGKIWLSYY
uniref:MD-2-related lipid-recognition domain-containing protein n=1 Tax=Glossina pallidipes TaxID=7398 RepID=A0A1B0AB32_GLOPL